MVAAAPPASIVKKPETPESDGAVTVKSPIAVAITSTVAVQEAPAGNTANPVEEKPFASSTMSCPPDTGANVVLGKLGAMQVVDALVGLATCSPVGSVAEKSRLPKATEFAVLSIVKVSVVVSPRVSAAGAATKLNAGLVVTTVKSIAGAETSVSEDVSVVAGSVYTPAAAVTILTETVQELPAPMSELENENVFATLVSRSADALPPEPPHEVVASGVAANWTPGGNVAAKAISVTTVVPVLLIV